MASKALYDLRGKVCIVTGAASGFGANLCGKLAKKGARIVLVDIQEELGRKVAAEVAAKYGVRISFLRIDLADPMEAKRMVDTVVNEWGSFDVLVNNAGVGGGDWIKAVEETNGNADPSSFIRMTNINFISLCFATELAIVHWHSTGKRGVVVNTASMAGLIPQKEPLYAASKAAVIHFTRCLEQYAPQVRVNTVLPNASPTPLFMSGADRNPEFFKMMQSHIVPVDQVTDAMMLCIEDESMAGKVVRAVPRGNDVWDMRNGRAEKIGSRM